MWAKWKKCSCPRIHLHNAVPVKDTPKEGTIFFFPSFTYLIVSVFSACEMKIIFLLLIGYPKQRWTFLLGGNYLDQKLFLCSLICATKLLDVPALIRRFKGETDKERKRCASLHNRKHRQATITQVEEESVCVCERERLKARKRDFHLFIFSSFSNTFHLLCMFPLCCSKTTSSDL